MQNPGRASEDDAASVSEETESKTQAQPPTGWRKYLSPRRRIRYGVAVCAVFFIGLCYTYASLLWTGNAGPKQCDYVAYFSAAHLVATGHAGDLYNFTSLGRYERLLVKPLIVRSGVLPYVYPPYFALVLAPLGAVPYTLSYACWLLINVAALVYALRTLSHYTGLDGGRRALFWTASLSFLPTLIAVFQGQTSLVTLALLTFVFDTARRNREPQAGVALGLALIKPPYILPFLILLLMQRRWRALAAFTAMTAAEIAIPTLLFGLSTDSGYLRVVRLAAGWHNIYGYDAKYNQAPAGQIDLLTTGSAATVLTAAVVLTALFLLVRAAMRGGQGDLVWGLAATVALIVSPHVLIHDVAVVLLSVGIALRYRDLPPGRLALVLWTGYLAVLFGLKLVYVVPIQLTALALLGFCAWLYIAAVNQPLALRSSA